MDPTVAATHSDVTIELHGQRFTLLPERAVLWNETQTLLASDLHWGKTEIFHQFGSALPDGILNDDLARLSQAITRTQAKRLLILGDLVHAVRGLTPVVQNVIADWRRRHADLQIDLVLGNHDRGLKLPPEWNITTRGHRIEEDAFIFTHDAALATPLKFTWSGHVHPVVRVSTTTDTLRLPCFEIRRQLGFLPAFSALTGGVEVKNRNAQVYAIAENHVVRVR